MFCSYGINAAISCVAHWVNESPVPRTTLAFFKWWKWRRGGKFSLKDVSWFICQTGVDRINLQQGSKEQKLMEDMEMQYLWKYVCSLWWKGDAKRVNGWKRTYWCLVFGIFPPTEGCCLVFGICNSEDDILIAAVKIRHPPAKKCNRLRIWKQNGKIASLKSFNRPSVWEELDSVRWWIKS